MNTYENKVIKIYNEVYGTLNSLFSNLDIKIPNSEVSQVYISRDCEWGHVTQVLNGRVYFEEKNDPILFSELNLSDAAELLDVLIKIKK